MDGFEYVVGLDDAVSGPAGKVVSALDRVQGSLKKTDDAAHHAATGISYLVRGFDDWTRGGKYAANGTLDLYKAAERLGPALAGLAVVGVGAALVKTGIEMGEFREQTELAYEALGADGKKLFGAVDTLAASVHMPAVKAHELTQELMASGLQGQAEVTQTVRAIADLQRAGLGKGAEKIKSIIEASVATGHLTMRGGRALAGTGVTEDAIAKELGLTVKQYEAQLKAGKITVEEGIAAIDHAIIGGKVGALATKKFTLSDAFTDLHNTVRKLFQETDASPLTDAMQRLTKDFEDGSMGAHQLSEAVDLVVGGIGGAIDGIVSFGETINRVFDAAWDKIDKVGDALATFGYSDKEAKDILAVRHARRAAQEVGGAVRAQDVAFEKVQALATSGASQKEILDTAHRLGIDVSIQQPGKAPPKTRQARSFTREIPGIENQVQRFTPTGGVGDVDPYNVSLHTGDKITDAMKRVGQMGAQGMVDGANDTLENHSPSHVMFDVGANAAKGFQAGAAAFSDMPANDTGAKASQPSGSKNVVVHVDFGGFHAHGVANAEDLAPLLESQIADAFERAALELGS